MLTENVTFAQKQYTLQSPDKDITVSVEVGEQITYSVTHGNTCMLTPSAIGMKLTNGTLLGTNPNKDIGAAPLS